MRMLLSLSVLLLLPVDARPQESAATAPRPMIEEYRFGNFTDATALSVDQFGHVYIVDKGDATVRKFDMRGKLAAEVGGAGWEDTQFDRPSGIDARLGLAVYVADYGNDRVARYDRGLRFMAALRGDDITGDGRFGYPLDVANSSLEQLFVLDGENNRVLALSGFRNVERVFGGIEAGEGRLTDPVAIATDDSRYLYVLESGRVAAFDLFGNFLFHFGSGLFADAEGITASDGRVLVITPDALHLFSARGDHRHSVTRAEMVLAGESGPFRDAAYTVPFLLILTKQSCILFPNN
ncbi:MAG: NHL repeat-containing protein [Bacteroidota bacterium]|nr:NHL repeat-containing protein [Bacteroidota bacterium]